MSAATLHALADELRAEGGLLADVVVAERDLPATAALGALAAAGPRAAGREAAIAGVVEAVHEGWLVHAAAAGSTSARPRLIATDDADLALLAGDRLYALGLAKLAALGDLDGIVALTDVIALCARALVDGDELLGHAAFAAGAAAVGWGTGPAIEAAKQAARDGDAGAADALRAAARQVAGELAPERA